mmetsp:Transcript_3141/g.10374  ORF Transcript_3141/g.10374 Transcript_3141/m.10374 type:complete len:497 (-) Transcript_3141:1233-2723(-)
MAPMEAMSGGNGVKVTLRTQLFIGNEFVDAESGKTFEVVNPATEETLAMVAEGDKADVEKAVSKARKAFETEWGNEASPAFRAKCMNKLAAILEEHKDEMATIETLDNGKPYAETSNADLPLAISHLRYYAGWADKITGQTFADNDQFVYTRKEPVGVVAAVIPWNFPLLMCAWKLGPCLAAGCCIIVKPAEQTPLSVLRLMDFVKEAGFPSGVIQVIPGYGPTAGGALAEHMDIDKIAFTGSVTVGKIILAASAKSNLKKVTLELGGKSPLVVFEDADLDEAVDISHMGIFFNQGEVCTAASRCFVHESVYDAFLEKAAAKATARADAVGDPFAEATAQGAQVSSEQFDTIMKYIDIGKKEGAKLVAGGGRAQNKGYFVQPTIFADVQAGMKIHDEEIFGPVLSVIKFTDLDDAIKKSNNSTYGLAAAVVTKDINKALKVAHSVKAGTVWVNTYHQYLDHVPFGGFKQSGLGREKGYDAIENYLEVKSVYVNYKK